LFAKGRRNSGENKGFWNMPAKIIDGKAIAQKVLEGVKRDVADLKKHGIVPGLAVVQVGHDPASDLYVKKKREMCKNLGMNSIDATYPENISYEELKKNIEKLNNDSKVHGIIVQLPLPQHLKNKPILELVDKEKDADGFNPFNQGKLSIDETVFAPATAKGVIKLIESTGTEIAGKNAVVVGRSNIVGKPTALLLINKNATVTVCHSKTKNLAKHTKNADILVVAVGKEKLIRKNMVKKGAIVIDVGTNHDKKGKLCGDVDFENVKKTADWITPVPGGVGPMTVACLMENTVQAAKGIGKL
jgi:methylenetetrahydrofolate dehydrogenase (NADP+)/methenyltetrahydrofolate cyclohydrolase